MVSECDIPAAKLLSEKPDKALARAGVYAIYCDANDRYYVGSSKNISIRIKDHLNSLLNSRHYNPRMQHAFSKYGANRFLFQALEVTESTSDALIACERKWIRDLDSVESGFNVMPAANCPLGVIRKDKAPFKAAMLARSRDPNSKNNRKYRFISPSGEEFKGFNIAQFCRDMGFRDGTKNNLLLLAKGRIGSFNGWTSPDSGFKGKPRGSPNAFSFTDSMGVIHAGNNISEFCRSIGVGKCFFAYLIKGMGNTRGWTITPGFSFEKKEKKERVLFSPEGKEHRFISVNAFCRQVGLNIGSVRTFLKSDAIQHKGWRKTPCS